MALSTRPTNKRMSGPEVLRALAKGVRRVPGQMNRVETQFDAELELRKRIGEVAWFKFEGITLKLAPDTRYTPDFAVMLADDSIELIDVKGSKAGPLGDTRPWIEEDALVKMKCAAELFPFRFAVVWFDKSLGWRRRDL